FSVMWNAYVFRHEPFLALPPKLIAQTTVHVALWSSAPCWCTAHVHVFDWQSPITENSPNTVTDADAVYCNCSRTPFRWCGLIFVANLVGELCGIETAPRHRIFDDLVIVPLEQNTSIATSTGRIEAPNDRH